MFFHPYLRGIPVDEGFSKGLKPQPVLAPFILMSKHISKSKVITTVRSAALLEVELLNKCTPLSREAHFEVSMLETSDVRTTFGGCDVKKVHDVVVRGAF